jgi:hypothetical protein
MTIFDLMTSQNLSAYWSELVQDEAPYPCEELFPDDKKMGLDLKWLKGAKGLPVVLKVSAFDVHAIPRARIGFEKLYAEIPFFKESTYIDEELRQQLNMVLETGNQAYIDSVMNNIFDDEMRLLRGARASRERMRMQALTTGVVAMANNGQAFTYDYGIPAANKVTVQTSWSDLTNSDPIKDIRALKKTIKDNTGVDCTRAMCDEATLDYICNNEKIKTQIFALRSNVGEITYDEAIRYVENRTGVRIRTNDMRYADEDGQTQAFMPADTFVMFPAGTLGKTWFGTTPQESDLMTSNVANVAITETGVSVTTAKKVDPVQVETIVAMICLPSFEGANHVGIIDVIA